MLFFSLVVLKLAFDSLFCLILPVFFFLRCLVHLRAQTSPQRVQRSFMVGILNSACPISVLWVESASCDGNLIYAAPKNTVPWPLEY